MSDYRFACPHCSQHLACADGFAGHHIQCPNCNGTMVIPRVPTPSPAASPHIQIPQLALAGPAVGYERVKDLIGLILRILIWVPLLLMYWLAIPGYHFVVAAMFCSVIAAIVIAYFMTQSRSSFLVLSASLSLLIPAVVFTILVTIAIGGCCATMK